MTCAAICLFGVIHWEVLFSPKWPFVPKLEKEWFGLRPEKYFIHSKQKKKFGIKCHLGENQKVDFEWKHLGTANTLSRARSLHTVRPPECGY